MKYNVKPLMTLFRKDEKELVILNVLKALMLRVRKGCIGVQ